MFLVLWVSHFYNSKTEQYEQSIGIKLFNDFDRAKEFAEELYENKLNPEADFVAILPCLALYCLEVCSQRDSDFDFNLTFRKTAVTAKQPKTGSRLEEGIV